MLKDQSIHTVRRHLEGEIDDTTLMGLMVYAMDQKLSGRLSVQDKQSSLRVFFEQGAVVHSDSTREDERLGTLILRKGRLSKGQLIKAEKRRQGVPLLRRFMPEKRFGEILLSMGVISRTELKGFLEYQTKQRLLHLFTIASGRFELNIHEINRYGLTDIPIQVDIREILFEGVKQHVPPRSLKAFYDLVRNAWPVRLRNELKNVSLSLASKDAYILTRLEGACGIDDVLRSCNLPHDETLRSLFALFCCDVLAIADVQRQDFLKIDELRAAEIEIETAAPSDSARQLKLVPPTVPGQVPMLQEPFTPVANSFRLLWTKLRALHTEQQRQVFCLTSGDTEEGKSFLAVNLALACAENPDYKVLLVDGDLHNPSIHKILGLSIEPGLSELLSETNPERAAAQPIRVFKVQRLHVLTAGAPTFNITELAGSAVLRDLLQRLRREYEIIIVDTPPFLPLVDTKILTDLSDGILIAARQGVTRRPDLQRLIKELESKKILGFVFDDVRESRPKKRYGQYYYST